MSHAPGTEAPGRDAPKTAPLSRLLAALSHEFTRAAAGHHATVAYWKQVYADNPVLGQEQPAAMRIVSAKVQLPIAIDAAESKAGETPQITRSAILSALPARLAPKEREDAATLIHQDLLSDSRGRLDDPKLIASVRAAARRRAPDIERDLDVKGLKRVQAQYASLPRDDSELSVVYRAEDLSRLATDSVFRVELELRLD